jgi:RHS repeat-associated protein
MAEGSVISLPKGGGAVSGLGEKFSPDLFTGTGNFSLPIAVPPGRNGVQPQLALAYSTGNGNGPFGLGWQLSLPGVTRKTSLGLPRYRDAAGQGDTFVLSGAEDLVPVAGSYPGRVRYRPRTEGLFARIEHVRDDTGDYWEVRGRDGLLTRYGTARPADAVGAWRDPAVTADPADPGRVFGWRITETKDLLGNLIRYEYLPDAGQETGHTWNHPLLACIRYADFGDRSHPSFLVTVEFAYEPRPDPFSDRRPGFDLRTTQRCHAIRTATHAADGVDRVAREYRFGYQQAPFNDVSLLARVDVVGLDDQGLPDGQPPLEENLPPLTFTYSEFNPAGRRFERVTGDALPTAALSDPALTLADLHGAGLPDVVELGATVRRYWRNAGDGRFDLPRQMEMAPPFSLADPGVQLIDADGDGRPDLLVTASAGSKAGSGPTGYFPMTFAPGWSSRSFRPYRQAPAASLADPGVKLVDLDGDGLTDVLRSGTRLECWFNDPDPRRAWERTARGDGTSPDVDLADPRVRLADMTGDGLHDIVIVRSGNVTYWPNLGHGRWGPQVIMHRAPRLPDGYDPRRVLLGDLDGDGAADLLYVDDGRVLLWGNQCGNAFTEQPVTITGTPDLAGPDGVQLTDLRGAGMAGLLYSRAADGPGWAQLRFLDPSGGIKPHLLTEADNHLGAVTRVTYRPSTQDYLRDQARTATRWRTTLPFPVHVVAHVEVTDAISGGRLTTEYRYHHGYWDGAEREFRGFAMVEQLDTETFDQVTPSGPGSVPAAQYSPPTLTKSWFHPGPVAAAEAGDWTELDLTYEYWSGDGPMLARPEQLTGFLGGLARGARRAALRTLRGQLLRSELYALDRTGRQDLPYTVTESISGVREEAPTAGPPDDVRERIFFPFVLGQRTTQWERGDDPMTRFTFPAGYDEYGLATGQVAVAVPRGRDPLAAGTAASQPYLATYSAVSYARRDDTGHYLVDRVCRATSYEVVNDGLPTVAQLRDAVLAGPPPGGESGVSLRVIGHTRTCYDGDAFAGLPAGQVGEYGLPVRTETLAFTDAFLDELYDSADPLAVSPRPGYLGPATATWEPEYPSEFRDRLPSLAGYAHHADGEIPGYYIASARYRYDVHDPARTPRGLPLSSLDPLGSETRTGYDEHDLLPVGMVDAAGLQTSVVNDHRMLQPRELTDPNGNATAVALSPAGLVTAVYVGGKDGEGDRDLPSTQMTYDLLAFAERGQPASVTTVRRVHHDTQADVPDGQRDEVLVAIEYSDGFGRTVQTRAQAEDTLFGDPVSGDNVIPADQSGPAGDTAGRTRAPDAPDNVIVSGWQIYDNKGRVVRKYEPFFAAGREFAAPLDAQLGQKADIFYDPRGQVIRTVNPDGSEQRAVLGVPDDLTDPDHYQPTAWESYAYDVNDNAGRTHPGTSVSYRDHWDTPVSVEVDALGRAIRAVTRNGADPADWFTTRTAYDIQGNPILVTDALGRTAFRYQFDLAKRRWRMDSIDAGRRDTVFDALGHPVESRDSKGAITLGTFDPLHRPARVWARDRAGGTVTLRQRIDYGDSGDAQQPSADRDAARTRNLLGRPVLHHDEAGLVTTIAVDFKGNPLQTTRRMIADAPIMATYEQAAANGWRVEPFQVDWSPAPGQTQAERDEELLEPAGYATSTAFDALNRVTRHTLPLDVEGQRRELLPAYNRAGALEQVRLGDTVYVQRIAYNAKGQRTLIAYGNGVMTRCAYHPLSFRLTRLRSEPGTLTDLAGGPVYRPSGQVLQDYGYDHDLAGNILTIRDRTPGSGIPGNPAAFAAADPAVGALLIGGDALDRNFAYDPAYRLIAATGREHQAPPAGDPWTDLPRGTDITKAQAYQERYRYDAAGNMLRLAHAGHGGFTRDFTVEEGSNRLRLMTTGTTPYDYAYDANGNMVAETTSRHFDWNHADQLRAFATQTPGAEPSVHAQYLYDAGGQRVKKLVRKQGGNVEVTHYLGDFEQHRWGGVPAAENNHVHIMDETGRIALARLGPAFPGDGGPAVQFHLGDHLGSATAVVDDAGALANREEFTPYGETSFGSFTRKRYRYTGQESDEESGLSYNSARYYLRWTARWAAVDPRCDVFPHHSRYEYAASNPNRLVDKSGRSPTPLTPEQHGIITDVEEFFGNAMRYAAENNGGFHQVEADLFRVHGEQAMAEMMGHDTGVLDEELAHLRVQRALGLNLSLDYVEAHDDVQTGFPEAHATTGYQQVPYRQLLTARLQLGFDSLMNGRAPADVPPRPGSGPPSSPPGSAPPSGRGGGGGKVGKAAGAVLTVISVVQIVGTLWTGNVKDAAKLAGGILAQQAMAGAAESLLGRAGKGAGFALFFFGGMRSDSSRYSKEEEEREMAEAGEKELRRLAGNYRDTHPEMSMQEARQLVIDSVLKEQQRTEDFWNAYHNALRAH